MVLASCRASVQGFPLCRAAAPAPTPPGTFKPHPQFTGRHLSSPGNHSGLLVLSSFIEPGFPFFLAASDKHLENNCGLTFS